MQQQRTALTSQQNLRTASRQQMVQLKSAAGQISSAQQQLAGQQQEIQKAIPEVKQYEAQQKAESIKQDAIARDLALLKQYAEASGQRGSLIYDSSVGSIMQGLKNMGLSESEIRNYYEGVASSQTEYGLQAKYAGIRAEQKAITSQLPAGEKPIWNEFGKLAGIQSAAMQKSFPSVQSYNAAILKQQPVSVSFVSTQLNPATGKPYGTLTATPSHWEQYKSSVSKYGPIKGTLGFLSSEAQNAFWRGQENIVKQGGTLYQPEAKASGIGLGVETIPYFTPAGPYLLTGSGAESLLLPGPREQVKQQIQSLQVSKTEGGLGLSPKVASIVGWSIPVASIAIGTSPYWYPRAKGYVQTLGRTEIPTAKLVPPDVLSGKNMFPQAPTIKQLNLFQTQSQRLPGQTIPSMYHATGDIFWKGGTTLVTPGTSEVPGLYGSYGVSPYFTRIGVKNAYSKDVIDLLFGDVLQTGGKPGVLAITPEGGFKEAPAIKVSPYQIGDTGICTKSPNEDKRGELDPAEDRHDSIWAEIRDECYRFALENWDAIQKIYLNFPKDCGLKRRELQIWKPILAIAKYIDEKSYEEMLSFAIELSERRLDDLILESSFDYVCLQALKSAIEYPHTGDKIYVDEIKKQYCMNTGNQEQQQDIYLNRNISNHLDKLGFKELRGRDNKASFFSVNPSTFDEIVTPICPTLSFLSTSSTLSPQEKEKEVKRSVDDMAISVDKKDKKVVIVAINGDSVDTCEKEGINKIIPDLNITKGIVEDFSA